MKPPADLYCAILGHSDVVVTHVRRGSAWLNSVAQTPVHPYVACSRCGRRNEEMSTFGWWE